MFLYFSLRTLKCLLSPKAICAQPTVLQEQEQHVYLPPWFVSLVLLCSRIGQVNESSLLKRSTHSDKSNTPDLEWPWFTQPECAHVKL